jgi:hypothetical protein
MSERSEPLDVEGDVEEVYERFYEEEMTDGLPIIPPSRDRVDRMLGATDREPTESLGEVPPKYGAATVEKVAVNAVMAGCKPAYLPVVIAAVEAMLQEEFNLYGINTTTHPVAPLLVVNGPIVEELNLNYGYNVFGPGWRANATIGRALRLVLLNVGGGTPGKMDRATHGQPGKFSFCIAENERKTPWDPLHVERGFDESTSTVTVFGTEGPHEVNDHISQDGGGVLSVMADVLATVGNNNAIGTRGELVCVFSPEHAETIANDGFSREDVRWFLYDYARNRVGKIRDNGPEGLYDWDTIDIWEKRFHTPDGDARLPLVKRPEDITVLVAGGAGKHSMVLHSFGETTSVTAPIER